MNISRRGNLSFPGKSKGAISVIRPAGPPPADSSLVIENHSDKYNYSSLSDFDERWSRQNIGGGSSHQHFFDDGLVKYSIVPDLTDGAFSYLGHTSLDDNQPEILNEYPSRDMIHDEKQYDGYANTKVYNTGGENATSRLGFFVQSHGFETDGYYLESWQTGEDSEDLNNDPELVLKKQDGANEITLDSTKLSSHPSSAQLFVTFPDNSEIVGKMVEDPTDSTSTTYGTVSAVDTQFNSGGWALGVGLIFIDSGTDLGFDTQDTGTLSAVIQT